MQGASVMTWHRDDGGRPYLERDKPSSGIDRTIIGMAPQAPETPVEPSEPDRTPAHPSHTAREYLAAVLDRIKAGELAAVAELPGALNAARKESRK
jgi:hypothetical protein